jgi:cytochrome c peroxidase
VASITYTGDGANIAYWNRYVAVTQMHGHGSWVEVRVSPPENVQNPPDRVTAKLAALQAYQLSLETPPAPAGTFNAAAAARGRLVFEGVAQCSICHTGNHFTDAPGRLHPPADVVSEGEVSGPSLASRSVTKMYRTTPLRGLWQRHFFFHNGAATALEEVVAFYNARKSLNLTISQQRDLVQYLRSL